MHLVAVTVVVLVLAAACGAGSKTAKPATPVNSTTPPAMESAADWARDRATQCDLVNALNSARKSFGPTQDYRQASPAKLAAAQADHLCDGGSRLVLMWGTLSEAGPHEIGVVVADKDHIRLVTQSASGRWFCIGDSVPGGTSFGKDTTRDGVATAAGCATQAWPSEPGASNAPQLAPLKQFDAAVAGPFDAKSFVAAFNPARTTCDATAQAARLDGKILSNAFGPAATDVRVTDATASSAKLETYDEGELNETIPVVQRNGRWLIDSDICHQFARVDRAAGSGCATEARTFVTAVNAYRAKTGGQVPPGASTEAVAATLAGSTNGGPYLQSPALNYLDMSTPPAPEKWSYNIATSTVSKGAHCK